MGDLRRRVEVVGTEASARAAEIESLRRLPDDLASSLVDTGIFRAWVPSAYGGDQADAITVLDAIEALSFHDGATGWCGMIGATSALLAAFLPPVFAEEIYGDPRAVTGGFAMPAGRGVPVDGGIVVDGRWPWGSGTYHCTWIGGGCLVEGGGAPFVLFSRDQVELLDTWHVAGLRGSGSTDYEVHGAFVPEGRWVHVLRDAPVVDAPLYRMPFMGLLSLGVCMVSLGLARRAQHELVELAGGKRPAGSTKTLAERQVVQAEVARAEAAWRSARAFVREVVDEAIEVGVTDEMRRRIRLAATDATWRATSAVDRMYSAGGGSAIHEAHPLQRVFRDAHVATQHGMVAERTYEPLGRMALGLPTDASQL